MKKRAVIDLPRVKASLSRLDDLARDHPAAFDPARLPTSERELKATLDHDTSAKRRAGRPRAEDPTVTVTARLPQSVVADLEHVLALRRADAPRTTMQHLLREAVGKLIAGEQRKRRRVRP